MAGVASVFGHCPLYQFTRIKFSFFTESCCPIAYLNPVILRKISKGRGRKQRINSGEIKTDKCNVFFYLVLCVPCM